jgi:hypothetical protein
MSDATREASIKANQASKAAKLFEARFRWDEKSDQVLADDLDRRSACLRNGSTNQANPSPESQGVPFEQTEKLVRCSVQGWSDYKVERIARRIWKTGECLWHAIWVLNGDPDGRGCSCSPCRKERGES